LETNHEKWLMEADFQPELSAFKPIPTKPFNNKRLGRRSGRIRKNCILSLRVDVR
jgi:hypothetical protein